MTMTADEMRTAKGMIFSGAMVRAILDGRKTMTRRAIKPQPNGKRVHHVVGLNPITDKYGKELPDLWTDDARIFGAPLRPGQLLYVKETHRMWFPPDEDGQPTDDNWHVRYQANNEARKCDVDWDEGPDYQTPEDCGLDKEPTQWHSPMFMPRWAARLWWRVMAVRPERLQEITEEDARAEGIMGIPDCCGQCRDELRSYSRAFRILWDSLNAKRGHGWEANPWVWVYTFQVEDSI